MFVSAENLKIIFAIVFLPSHEIKPIPQCWHRLPTGASLSVPRWRGLGGGQDFSNCAYHPFSLFTYHRLYCATLHLLSSARRVIVRRVGLQISIPCPRQRGTIATRTHKILSCCSLQEGEDKQSLSTLPKKPLNLTRMPFIPIRRETGGKNGDLVAAFFHLLSVSNIYCQNHTLFCISLK